MTTATLLHLEQIEPGLWALRFSSFDQSLFDEIKETVKSFSRHERRWDPYACENKGTWVVADSVLDDLEKYFPTMHRQRFPQEKKDEEGPYSCPF
jgi:hypothetical protein